MLNLLKMIKKNLSKILLLELHRPCQFLPSACHPMLAAELISFWSFHLLIKLTPGLREWDQIVCLSTSSQSWATPFVTSVLSCQRPVTSPSWLLPYKFNTLIQWFDYPQCVQWEHSSYFYNCAQCTIRNITINLQLVGQGRGQPHCRKVMRPSLESWLCSFPFVTTLSITFPVILYLSSKIFYGRDILSMNISAL